MSELPPPPLTDDEARAAIPLLGSTRDPERVSKGLAQWLAPRIGAGRDLRVSALTTPSGTGVANETLLFEATWTPAAGPDAAAAVVGERTQGFVARVANPRPLYIEADIRIHHDMYAALADVADVPVPQVFGFEPDPELLGAPFFVMERISGDVPGDQPPWTTAGFVFDASPAERRAMWENAVSVLAALHQVDVARFPFLAPAVAGRSGLADHLAYWRRYLDDTSAGAPHDVLERGYEWLLAHLPADEPTGLSWGDSRFANIMFRGTEVVAIFDWDTVSLAGPEADLAWWRFMDGPNAELLDGIGDRDELVTLWSSLTGRSVDHLEFYDVFTTFRLGNILLRLFGQLGADGVLPPEVAREQARNSAPTQALAAQLAVLG